MQVYRFLIYLLYLLISTIRDNEGSTQSYVICDSKECRDTASKVKNKLNLTVDPCDDFYEFACGGWKANNPAAYPPLKNEFLNLKEKVKQQTKAILVEPQKQYNTVAFGYAKEIYNMCVNLPYDMPYSRGLTALDTFSQRFGVWPITLSLSEWSTMEDNVTWQDMIGKMHDNFFENGLFEVGIVQNIPVGQYHYLYIGKLQNFFSNKLGAMYENFNNDIRKKNIYTRYIESIAKYIARNRGSNVNMTMVTEDARNIVDFEINLRKEVEDNKLINPEIMDIIDSGGFNTSINYPLTVHELQQIYNRIVSNSKKTELNWKNILQRTFGPLGNTISSYDLIQIPSWHFFVHLVSLLERTPIRTILNFIQWSFIRERIGYTCIEMEGLYTNFYDSMGLYQIRPRWENCLDMLISECSSIFACMNFDAAISYTYTERYERPGDKGNITDMIADIVCALREQINASTWTDKWSKKNSIDKLYFMTPYVSSWYSKEEIDQLHKNLIITPESGYLDNVLKVQIDIKKTYLSLLKQPSKKKKLPLPLAVSTFSNVNDNSVYFPISIIEDPFQNATRPIAMNYGAIGQLIGQEINHGFDTFGSGFLKDGSTGSIWTLESKNKYPTITQCFIDQFNSYEVPGLGVIYDRGNLTVNENLVDAAGLKAAFKAYKNKKTRLHQPDLRLEGLEEYNQDQLFFMSYAQTRCETKTPGKTVILYSQPDYSPYELKVRGTLSNMAEFSEAYKCSNEAKMNPVNKCVLWH